MLLKMMAKNNVENDVNTDIENDETIINDATEVVLEAFASEVAWAAESGLLSDDDDDENEINEANKNCLYSRDLNLHPFDPIF